MNFKIKHIYDVAIVILPIISVFISYNLGIRHSLKEYISKTQEDRYHSLYAPFIQWLFSSFVLETRPSSAPLHDLERLFDLIFTNLKYLDSISLRWYYQYHYSYLNLIQHKKDHSIHTNAPKKFDRIFYKLGMAMLLESSSLASELQLPILIEPFYEKFSTENTAIFQEEQTNS